MQHKLFEQHRGGAELRRLSLGEPDLVEGPESGPAGTEQANPGCAQRNALRPYKGYGEIYQYTNGAHSNYNSLQARMQTRFRKGGLVTLSYTWSKCLSMGSAYNYSPQDSNNLAADYGPCSYNQPKIFVASYVYPLPFWQHEHDLVQGGSGRAGSSPA